MASAVSSNVAHAHATTGQHVPSTDQIWQVATTVALVAAAAIAIVVTCLFAPVAPLTILGVAGAIAAIIVIARIWSSFSSGNAVIVNGRSRDRVVFVDHSPTWLSPARWSPIPLALPPPAVFHIPARVHSPYGVPARGHFLHGQDRPIAMRDGLHQPVGAARFMRR